ncbi:uncharacterized protein EDB91DRAFT_480441 [Suillus paluster]|uniref:uncharacterized protein n=1 Tax=Suillus paluster TaxID=48578 RepID=UPI001B86A087|nr:uncharacterized protein EDB91DRAFT_480441 [Suillus paluster]KAG1737509.1 hypothetical protein EDB91DRAFT_480441 [Suillus paluster]
MINTIAGYGMFSSVSTFCRTLLWLALSVVACSSAASARPTGEVLRRSSTDSQTSGGNSVSATVWIPVLIVAVVVGVLTLIGCVRRVTYREVGAGAVASTQNQSAGQTAPSRPGRRRRPRRTPSQISTKSLPPYMQEPGDQELVIYRGPLKVDEDPNDPLPILEEDDEHLEARGAQRNPDLESHGTSLADNSPPNLTYNAPGDVSVRRSVDVASVGTSGHSHESHSELLPSHATQAFEDPRGEAPPYFEVVGQDTPETSRNASPAPETSIGDRERRSRFSFLFKPFGGSSRYPPVSVYNRAVTPDHIRSVSSLSVASTNSGHRRNRSGSNSALLKTLRPSGHSAIMTSPSTISLDSISAPLTHTATRSEFRAPKGGLTPEQIKLITSRNALEKFGVPYGPDAVAFSASRSNMAPPPDFDATISSSPGQASGSTSADLRNTSSTSAPSTDTAGSSVHNGAAADEAGQTPSDSAISGSSLTPSGVDKQSQPLLSPYSPSPTSYDPHWADSRSSSVTSFETANSELSRPPTPLTARPVTPVTARPFVL